MKEKILNGWPATKRYALLVLLLSIVAFRLFLVSDRDILATFSPYDEYWHVDAALRRVIGGHYHHMVFAHLPMYAIWLMVLSDFGIPARLAVDVFWLAGSGYLAFALSEYSRKIWAGILAFILLAYHPYSLVLFDRALAETFLAVLSVIVLAAALEIWNLRQGIGSGFRRKFAMVVFGVVFAIAFHTRKEGILLLIPIIVMAILSWIKSKDWWSQDNRNYLGIPLIVVPIMTTLVLGIVVASVNYARWGVFARYELAAPQYVRAIKALIAIDPGKLTPRHVTITAETREAAYRASPTFAQLRPYFDGGVGQNLARMTSEMDQGVTGEIGDWVFYWAIRDAASSVGWHSNAKNAEKKYAAIADELEHAFSTGVIKERPTIISFIDPDWKKWVRYFPSSTLNEINLVMSPSISPANLDRPLENATSKQFADFSLLLGRRRVPQHAEMVGWALAPAGSLIGFGGDHGGWSWKTLDAPVRLDVAGAIPFSIRGSESERPSKLYVRLANGETGKLDLSGLAVGQIREIDGLEGTRVGIEHLYVPSELSQTPRLERLSEYIDTTKPDAFLVIISKIWSLITWALLASTLATIFVAVFKKTASESLFIIGLLSVVVLTRAGLFGILDASSWYSQASRYMFPAVPFFIMGIVVGATSLLKFIQLKNKNAGD